MDTVGLRTYMLTFSVDGANLPTLEHFIKNSTVIVGYWNYIPYVYCLKSYSTATDLARIFDVVFPKGNFIIVEINPSNLDGRLVQGAWGWFYEPVSALPLTPSGLSPLSPLGLLGGNKLKKATDPKK
jgi:hypothetical protein